MRTPRTLPFALLLACASTNTPPPQPADVDFAAGLLARTVAAPRPPVAEPEPFPPVAPPARPIPEGLLRVDPTRLDELSAPGFRADGPVTGADLEALALLRAPAVSAARAQLEAARTEVQQSADLAELLRLYRAYAQSLQTRVGPRMRMDRAEGWPDVDAWSGELVQRTVAIAREQVRGAARDAVAEARRVAADGRRVDAARRILDGELELQRAVVAVARARYESGSGTQAGLLAMESRLERLATDRANLDEEALLVRARANRLLDRPESRPIAFAPAEPPTPGLRPDELVARALRERPEVRIAGLAEERAAIAVRLAERMTLPGPDVGAVRAAPAHDFGVRAAQVDEMRARHAAMTRMHAAARNGTETAVRAAVTAHENARRRLRLAEGELVPRAERAFETTRGAYEGNRAGWLELLDTERQLLAARLAAIDARRDLAHADAALLEAVGGNVDGEETR